MSLTPQINVVFIDIDGTIVSGNRIVPSAQEAITRMESAGRTVVLCTGRSALHARPVQAELGLSSAVYFNGGLSVVDGCVVDQHPLERGVVSRIIELATTEGLPLVFHTAEEALVLHEFPARVMPVLAQYHFPPLKRVTTDTLSTHTVFQGNLLSDASWDAQIAQLLPECYLYRWHPLGMDLQKLHCDKSVGAMAVLRHLGQSPEHALHIGDGGNDIGMFRTMGHSVAMGNAEDEVKQAANMLTSAVEEDGVFQICEKLGLFES